MKSCGNYQVVMFFWISNFTVNDRNASPKLCFFYNISKYCCDKVNDRKSPIRALSKP